MPPPLAAILTPALFFWWILLFLHLLRLLILLFLQRRLLLLFLLWLLLLLLLQWSGVEWSLSTVIRCARHTTISTSSTINFLFSQSTLAHHCVVHLAATVVVEDWGGTMMMVRDCGWKRGGVLLKVGRGLNYLFYYY